jgi:hypothetical protein
LTRAVAALVGAVGLVVALALWGSGSPAAVTSVGGAGVVLLALALFLGSGPCLGIAVAALGVAAVLANGEVTFAAIAESAVLVVVAELAWWSIELRPAMPAGPGTFSGRWLTVGALICGATSAAAWVLVAGRLDTTGIVGPLVGAAGAVSLAALGWGLDRSRYD